MSQDDRPGQPATNQPDRQPGRSTAEWVTLGVSCLIVLGLLGLVTYLSFTRGDRPATIEVMPRLNAARQSGDVYYVPVAVKNSGDKTAESVRVQVRLTTGQDASETSEFEIQFLAGGATAEAIVVFSRNPAQGEISASVVSYLEPA